MKIEESPSVSTIPVSKIPLGGCFKYQHRYCMRTDVSYAYAQNDVKIAFVDLSTGIESTLDSDVNVYAVDAVIQINKVGVIDDTSK